MAIFVKISFFLAVKSVLKKLCIRSHCPSNDLTTQAECAPRKWVTSHRSPSGFFEAASNFSKPRTKCTNELFEHVLNCLLLACLLIITCISLLFVNDLLSVTHLPSLRLISWLVLKATSGSATGKIRISVIYSLPEGLKLAPRSWQVWVVKYRMERA